MFEPLPNQLHLRFRCRDPDLGLLQSVANSYHWRRMEPTVRSTVPVSPTLLSRAGLDEQCQCLGATAHVSVQARSAGKAANHRSDGGWSDMSVWRTNCVLSKRGPVYEKVTVCSSYSHGAIGRNRDTRYRCNHPHHRKSSRNRSGRRRARNVGVGAAGGAAAGAIIGRGRGAGAGAVIGGTAGALTPTRRR